MPTDNKQITNNLNSNNSQTNYLYMELLHVDDSNEAFSGFCSQILKSNDEFDEIDDYK